MNYNGHFADRLDALRSSGNYRVFAELERVRGRFPAALHHGQQGPREVTMWCSNDYLGMGQHPVVVEAMHAALDRVGAGSGGTRNIAGTGTVKANAPPFANLVSSVQGLEVNRVRSAHGLILFVREWSSTRQYSVRVRVAEPISG